MIFAWPLSPWRGFELARGNPAEAAGAIEKAAQAGANSAAFSPKLAAWWRRPRSECGWRKETGQQSTAGLRHLTSASGSHDLFRYEDELARITQARVAPARNKPDEAIWLLSRLEESAQVGGRAGRLIEIILLKALARQAAGDTRQALADLTASLTLAEPEGYVRIFLDEGPPMQRLLAKALAQVDAGSLAGLRQPLALPVRCCTAWGHGSARKSFAGCRSRGRLGTGSGRAIEPTRAGSTRSSSPSAGPTRRSRDSSS